MGDVFRIGIRPQDHLAVLGDGAEWIDQTAAWLFPKALCILDYYHASEGVWAVANARWGEASFAQWWTHSKLGQLKHGRVEQVMAAMQGLKICSEERQRVRQAAINYMRARQAQMYYDEDQAAGCQSVVELSTRLVNRW